MKNTFQNLAVASVGLIALAAIAPAPAQALTFDFSVLIYSGSLTGETFTGSFSFDDSNLTGVGGEYVSVDSLSFDFLGQTFTEADEIGGSTSAFFEGEFRGLDFFVSRWDSPFSFSFFTGSSDSSDSLFVYDVGYGVGYGHGSITFTEQTGGEPIPEPLTVVGSVIFGGFGALGLKARAKKRKTAA